MFQLLAVKLIDEPLKFRVVEEKGNGSREVHMKV